MRYLLAITMVAVSGSPAGAGAGRQLGEGAATEAAPASATDPAAQAAAAKQKAANRKICRTSVVTGSRLQSERICRTAAEWDALEKETRETWTRRDGVQNTQPRQ